MKRVAVFILSCIVTVALADVAFGAFSNWYVKNKDLPGDYRNVDYLVKRCRDDVVILGSSIALNSLVPAIIEDSLGMTCFNGGANGQTLPFYESMLTCLLARYTPKMIILGLKPGELDGNGTGGRYNFLVPYYDKGYAMIDSCLEAKDRLEPWLLRSNLYRYNTIWWRILLYHFITPGEPGEKGFVAKGIPAVFPTLYEELADREMTEERKAGFRRMAARCRAAGVRLVVYFPPQYYRVKGTSATIGYVEDYCRENTIPCFDDSRNDVFLRHKELFYDNVHLNKNGAPFYTRMFVERLQCLPSKE